MKLLYRLFVTLSIFAVLIAAAWFALPAGLMVVARHQLQQTGFTDVVLEIDTVGLQSSQLSYVQLSNDDVSLRALGLQLNYRALELLNGKLDSIHLDQLNISLNAVPTKSGPAVLPDPALLSVVLSSPVVDWLPVSSLSVDELLVYAADGHRMMSASGAIQKQGQQAVHGEFHLSDSKFDSYRLQLDSSPQTGLNFELYPSQENGTSLISVELNKGHENEVVGRLSMDLAAISVLLDIPASLSGKLKADIHYSTEFGQVSNPFAVVLDGHSLLISGWKIDTLTSQLRGEIELADSQLKLTFADDAKIQAKGVVYDGLHLTDLRLQLPGLVSIAQNGQRLVMSKDAGLVLDGLKLDNLSVPAARLSEIGFELNPDVEVPEQCTVSASLDMPLLEMDAVRFELAQLLLEGRCPVTTSAWDIKARTDTLIYEDAEIRTSLNQCQLSIGNAEHGQLLDPDPAELGGVAFCESGDITGGVLAEFHLHALNGVGRTDFSVVDVQPNDARPLLSSVYKEWAQPFEIVSGNISFEGVYRWWKSGSGKHRERLVASITVKDAGGHYQDILFSGLNYQDTIELLPKFNSSDLSKLSISDIDIGLPVTEFNALLSLTESATGSLPVVRVEELSLSILQGRIRTEPILMDMNLPDQSLMLKIEGLNLQQIVAMQQLEGLSASGLLDGYMPVTLSADGANIIGGKINARAPGGRIQYAPQDAADISDAALGAELLMDILEDLNYHSMIVDVNYAEDGEMDMQLSIKGLSPQVDEVRPVHFNLSLQQNLLTLLQSLRYVEGIDNSIDKDVRDYFNQQKE